MARLLELRGLNCPAAVEEMELFADAADERLLAWAFCGREADKKDLLRWAVTLQREMPEIIGVTFFSSRRRVEEDGDARPKAAGAIRCHGHSLSNEEPRLSGQRGSLLPGQPLSGGRTGVGRDTAMRAATSHSTSTLAGGLFSAALAAKFSSHFCCRGVTDIACRPCAECSCERESGRRANRGFPERELPRSRPVQKKPDLIVLDPPRTGAGKAVIRSLVELGAPAVRYVSCDPATLARDLSPPPGRWLSHRGSTLIRSLP